MLGRYDHTSWPCSLCRMSVWLTQGPFQLFPRNLKFGTDMVVVWTAENGSYWSRITWKVMIGGEESVSSKHWSLPGSSVHGILQTRILEWVAIPFSRESSWPRDWTLVSCIAGGFFNISVTKQALLSQNISQITWILSIMVVDILSYSLSNHRYTLKILIKLLFFSAVSIQLG